VGRGDEGNSKQATGMEGAKADPPKTSLLTETKQLETEILAAFDRLAVADEESKEKLEARDRYNAGRDYLRKGLDELEPKVSAVIPLLPEELASQPKLEKAIVDHQKYASFNNKNHIGLNTRLTAMLTILIEAEKFNQVVTPYGGFRRQKDPS